MSRRWGWMAVVAALSFVTGGWLVREKPEPDGNVYQQARLFEDVLSAIRQHYVDSISETDLYYRATQGIVDHLRDPYSTLLIGGTYRRYTQGLKGVETGIGVQLDVRDGWITVIAPEPGSPAELGGLAPGDQILAVNGTSIKGWKIDQTAAALRGEVGSKVMLLVRKPGHSKGVPVRLTRAEIKVPSATGYMIRDSIGYVRLRAITAASADELAAKVAELSEQGMRALALDLRRNPGGLLSQGVKVADLFLDSTQAIGTLRGRRDDQVQEFLAQTEQQWPDLPVVVLVDRGTASSAELVAGAWQDHDRAVILGTPTFGKAVVQSTFPLGRDIAVKLTTARWFTPSGRSIQRPLTLFDSVAVAESSATRRVFHSDTGRPLESGHGIVPDVVVRQLAPGAEERALLRAIGEDLARYRELLAGYAHTAPIPPEATAETFRVTAQMRADLFRRVRADGIRIPSETYEEAADVVSRDLGDEIVRARFGEDAAQSLRLRRDRQLQAALRLLERTRTPPELLDSATARADGAAR